MIEAGRHVPYGSATAQSSFHSWMPVSPCGAGCMPRRGAVGKAGLHRVALRLGRVLGAILAGTALALAIPVFPARMRERLVRRWFRGLLVSFGVRYTLHGEDRLVGTGALFVSNHVSWLDVVVLQAVRPMRLVAKEEVRSWPVIGRLADRVGTLYIDRERLTTLPRSVRAIADALREGAAVGAFPEGTTWCGLAAGQYRPAVFQAAVDAGARVQPMALRFRVEDGRRTTAAAFVGDATLLDSVLTVLRTRGLLIEVFVLPELDAERVADRRELARRAQDAVAAPTPAPSRVAA
jgi:1-acyl-sn-glycerol-3-phosphate acyltransferase